MYTNSSPTTQVFSQVLCPQDNRIPHRVSEAGYDLVRTELTAYGEKIFGSSSAYLRTNGPWIRTTERVGSEFSYKPPVYDINASDLYIPTMAFGTYLALAGFFLGINGKFSPEALGQQFSTALLCWLLQVLLLEAVLHSLGGGDVPVLDMVAYGGHTFIAACVIVLGMMIWDCVFCVLTLWESFCMGVFLMKTMKRILVAEVKLVEMDSNKRNYLLLFMAVSQIPLLFWLGSICAKNH